MPLHPTPRTQGVVDGLHCEGCTALLRSGAKGGNAAGAGAAAGATAAMNNIIICPVCGARFDNGGRGGKKICEPTPTRPKLTGSHTRNQTLTRCKRKLYLHTLLTHTGDVCCKAADDCISSDDELDGTTSTTTASAPAATASSGATRASCASSDSEVAHGILTPAQVLYTLVRVLSRARTLKRALMHARTHAHACAHTYARAHTQPSALV